MNRTVLYVFAIFISVQGCFAQDDYRRSFSDFSSSTRRQYRDYSEEAEREFVKALQANWEAFNVFDAQVRVPVKPASDTLVPACSVENRQIDITGVKANYRKEARSSRTTDAVYSTDGPNHGRNDLLYVSFDFYGVNVRCAVPSAYKSSLRLNSISEDAVSSFWGLLYQKGVSAMASSIRRSKNELNLNDWALFEFVGALSNAVFPENARAEKAVFTVFCMNRMGLNCKVARAGSSLIPLFAADQEIYGRKYIEVDQVKYYIADADANVSKLNTYSAQMPHVSVNMDLAVASNPKIGNGDDMLQTMNSSVLGESFSLPVNGSLISFYGGYPQTDVNVYAGAEPDSCFSQAVVDSIKPGLAGKSGVEALNTLLSFVQKDFRYRTDTDQFGKEKPYFIEENFVYPYNDCEDRAVLFTFLVRKILGYDCILLQYSDHVNCAVRIDGEADGYFVRRGDSKYYVCDPTCQGAEVGMSGKDYRVKPQKIWIL